MSKKHNSSPEITELETKLDQAREGGGVVTGSVEIDASVKAARFVRFCDAFGIPL